jgi:hypothetical protein
MKYVVRPSVLKIGKTERPFIFPPLGTCPRVVLIEAKFRSPREKLQKSSGFTAKMSKIQLVFVPSDRFSGTSLEPITESAIFGYLC